MADHPAHLLVAEDNRVNRLLLVRSLEQQGHRVSSAENGVQALQILEDGNHDLLLLDVHMPEMDGIQVLEKLANNPRLRDLPVIVTSAVEELTMVVRCLELGADDYLNKPVNPVLLKARINNSLEKKRLRDQQQELVRRFATAEVAEDLAQSGFALGGRRIRGTVMFCDIREFTSMAEKHEPEEVIALLNDYYALMFDGITNHGGIVNLMIGDGLMAIFGAPQPIAEPALSAVHAARDMIALIEGFNSERIAHGKAQIAIGVGIATGEMIAGYAGTHQRATYTCIGDTVNLAARLEAHTKVAGRPILIDAETNAALAGRIPADPIGAVHFKGKSLAMEVFAV